jgi:chromosome segregation protein
MQITIKRTEIVNSIKLNTRLQDEISQKNQKIDKETKLSLSNNTELKDKIKKQNNSINDISSKLKNKNISINSQSNKIIDLKTNLNAKTTIYNDIKDELGNKKAHLNSLQELQNNLEGFDEGVRKLMSVKKENRSEINGLVGLLADFIVTEKENETALETALGRKLQTVIFNSTDDGLKAIEYLKNQNNGKISFQTASTVNQKQSSQNISNCTPLLELVRSKSNNDKIINSLLSDVYLVDDLTNAIKIWENNEEKYTFVTSSGDLIDARGTISGGSNVNSGSGILKRNREIREYTESINQLEAEFSTIKDAKENIEKELNESNILLEQLTKEQNELNILLVQETTIHEQLKRENLLEEDKLNLLKNEAKENSDLLAKHQNDIKLLKLDNELIEKDDQKKQIYLAEITASEISQRESLAEIETANTELRILLASIKQKKESLANDIARLNNELTVSGTKIDSLKIEKNNLESSLGTLSTNIETIKNHQQAKILKSQELSKLIEEQRISHHSLKEIVDTDNELLKSLRTRWDEIEPKVHEIELKLNEASLNTKHLEEDLADKYAVSIDNLPPAPEDDSFNIEETNERLYKLKKRLESIGDVNLGAAKEFEELENRYNFLNEQADDLHQSIDSLQNVISKINKITRQKFSETFNEINNHFKELFPLLFNGGKAYMQLTEESNILETGIDIFAQPPGKKLQSLDLLSGGERALTVISLMFAIFLTKPSPFCLMDEIDAPLDDSNIGRFISHLHKMAKRSQFLIVTHNKLSMQAADSLYGVTMEEKGVSKIVSVDLN